MLRNETAEETRFDRETAARVTALAQRLQSRHEETLTANQIEEIGAEVGLAPAFIRQAITHLQRPKTVQRPVPVAAHGLSKRLSRAWWASGWALPFILLFAMSDFHSPGPPTSALAAFFVGWALYFGLGVFLSHSPADSGQAATGTSTLPTTGALPRLVLLERVFEIQRELEGRKRHAAFLSVDVVGSTEMKHGAAELEVEYSFSQFSAWVREVVGGCGGEVETSAGDGMMCRFSDDAQAVRAARQLQDGISAFNTRRNRLRAPFRIRCGISAGVVPWEEGLSTGHLHSPVIDRAATLQKAAAPGDIVVSEEVAGAAIGELGTLTRDATRGAGVPAYSWRAGGGGS